MQNEEKSIEDSLSRLSDIVTHLETSHLTLDESLSLFEKGIGHIRNAKEIINNAELRVQNLRENFEG